MGPNTSVKLEQTKKGLDYRKTYLSHSFTNPKWTPGLVPLAELAGSLIFNSSVCIDELSPWATGVDDLGLVRCNTS